MTLPMLGPIAEALNRGSQSVPGGGDTEFNRIMLDSRTEQPEQRHRPHDIKDGHAAHVNENDNSVCTGKHKIVYSDTLGRFYADDLSGKTKSQRLTPDEPTRLGDALVTVYIDKYEQPHALVSRGGDTDEYIRGAGLWHRKHLDRR